MPLIMPNFIAVGQKMYEKSVTNLFTPFSILTPHGNLLVCVHQGSPILALMDSKAPSINLLNFVNFVDDA